MNSDLRPLTIVLLALCEELLSDAPITQEQADILLAAHQILDETSPNLTQLKTRPTR